MFEVDVEISCLDGLDMSEFGLSLNIVVMCRS